MKTKLTIIMSSVIAVAMLVIALNFDKKDNTDSNAKELFFYCAAGSKPPISKIADEYEKEYGVTINIQYGGSGTLLSSIRIANKGDLYLAADQSYIKLAKEHKLIKEVIPIAYQYAVIAVKKGNPKKIAGLEDLYKDSVKVALAEPNTAAIGKFVKNKLSELNQWKKLESNVQKKGVFKPTVNEIANDVKIGTVDAAIIWDNVAAQYTNSIDVIKVPLFSKSKKLISISILSASKSPTEALRFARYICSRDKGLKVFKKMGYNIVNGDKWALTPELVLFSGGVNRLAVQKTIAEFEKREGVKVLTTYQGCGILVGEMKAGKRPDAYFACDVSYMQQVKDLFNKPKNVSETDMVILVKKGNPKGINGLESLTKKGIKVAVANPKYSALGGLTVKLLKEAGCYDEVKKNITYGDAPTADFLTVRVKTGREDAAIVYRANTMNIKDDLEVIEIKNKAAVASQPISVSKTSDYPYTMSRLVDAILSSKSEKRFESNGFRWKAKKENDI